MMTSGNPYRWDAQSPKVTVPRTELITEIVSHLGRGTGVTFLAGRGMGKSVLLAEVERVLQLRGDVSVVRFSGPPLQRTLEGCIAAIAAALGVARSPTDGATVVIARHLAAMPGIRSVCLLYDEVDQYAVRVDGEPLSRQLFNHLELARKDLDGQLGVIVAGGMGLFHLRSVDASPFISRAVRPRLPPFNAQEIARLAEPLGQQRGSLTEEFLLTLARLSGGNPALTTYALQALWDAPSLDARALVEVFDRFIEEQRDFVWSFRKAVLNEALSAAPRLVLDLVRRCEGVTSRSALRDACRDGARDDLEPLDPHDVVDVLESAGLVRREGSLRRDPIRLHAIASVLNLGTEATSERTLRAQLRRDLARVLADLHSMSVDFFRSPSKGAKELVPESVFCAVIALGLRLLGWVQVEREAVLVAGRTDIKARHDSFPGELAVIEVKIWPRNDYADVHAQVLGYWSSEVTAAAVVMLSDARLDDWADAYALACLHASGIQHTALDAQTPLRAVIAATSVNDGGVSVTVDHHLLRLPKD